MTDELIRLLAESDELKARLYLVKNHVPFDVAFSLEAHEITAYSIIFGEMDGEHWDWDNMRWRPQDR